jgi:hypothetical protein
MELPEFLLRVVKATRPPEEGPGMMSIIIRRPYSHLEKELRSAFEGQEDVKIIVDRRYSERRGSVKPYEIEHRRADRRRPKEEIAEVLI